MHERTHMWTWTSKEEFVRFVGRNKSPSIQIYMADWTPQQKQDVTVVIAKLLEEDFPNTDTFQVSMIATVVVGSKK